MKVVSESGDGGDGGVVDEGTWRERRVVGDVFEHNDVRKRRRCRSSPVREATASGAASPAPRGLFRAYYSAHPPLSPLSLYALPVRASSSPSTDLLAINTQYTDVATATPTFPLTQKKNASQNRRRVGSILRELVTSLPTERPHCVAAESPLVPATTDSARSASATEPPRLTTRYRDVAVQALEVRGSCDGVMLGLDAALYPELATTPRRTEPKAREARETRDCNPGAAWANGVRELRNAHVRLVLRQLRHLHRLNTAVDRATAAAATPAPRRD